MANHIRAAGAAPAALIYLKTSRLGGGTLGAMTDLIIFRCPQTGMDVQTLLYKQGKDEARTYEAVTCPACTRLHFIDKSTGKTLGQDK